jgi:hypothetical protein
MLSESARMSSAAEARFRVQASPSTPRATTVIALDAAGEGVVRRLAMAGWEHATFLTVVRSARLQADLRDGPADARPHVQTPSETVLSDLAGGPRDLDEEIDAADLVIFVAGPGGHAQAAPLIGQACSGRRVMTMGFIVGVSTVSGSALSKTLAQVRPWSLMVVIGDSDDYIDDMMTALRA